MDNLESLPSMHILEHKHLQQDNAQKAESSSLATNDDPLMRSDVVHPMQASIGMTLNCLTNEPKHLDIEAAAEPKDSSADECSCKGDDI
jgi:hypothetical protein